MIINLIIHILNQKNNLLHNIKIMKTKFKKNKKYWVFYLQRICCNEDWKNYCIYYLNSHNDFISEWVTKKDIEDSKQLSWIDFLIHMIRIKEIKSYIY